MSEYTPIDLSGLPAPTVVETLSVEDILAEALADLQANAPTFDAIVESDPSLALLEVGAYREVLTRQRVNDACREIMLAYATGANLEQLSALFGVTRKLLDAGNPDAVPPVPATYETDSELRYRTQLSLEGLSVAGPVGAYQFHALSVAGVKDVGVEGPPTTNPGEVLVTILAIAGDGTASSELVEAVDEALNAETVRPLTDNVFVQTASIHNYEIIATLYIGEGPDPDLVKQNSLASVQSFASARHRVGLDVRLTALHAALHVAGVERVTLSAPGITADFVAAYDEAPYCTGITLSTATA